ncbi:helix-turn-helix domain-containing protein [Methylobacterium iners]|uniref:HTH cro/C1-type domain-containing protein n=1 Tax=Methylobacterium iners TaxID=418707 RepID=A0ABQ4S5Q8_9HYPH|nr:helix-turn-helix transcriptional regulator [Methylobacterium iners]GJD97487.1 hypothetical protein OCOJLMKI_4718 [Methylobacterium iners]
MQFAALETLLKRKLHDAVVGAVMEKGLDRHDLCRLTGQPWSRQAIYRLLAGPEQHACSADRLERIARALGLEAEVEVRVRPAGPRQLPQRHAVPLAA